MIYSSFLEEVSLVKATAEVEAGMETKSKSRKPFDIQACTDWWRGKSDLSKKAYSEADIEEGCGIGCYTPSFDRGCLSKAKRQEKIEAAKLRIQKVMHPEIADSDYSNDLCFFGSEKPEKNRRELQVEIYWEDLVIETLLLHSVKEEEIEKGHYNTVLALHVFGDGIA